jgi:hypothetical protein
LPAMILGIYLQKLVASYRVQKIVVTEQNDCS